MKYLHIVEYSTLIPYKIPIKESKDFDLYIDDSIIRSSVVSGKSKVSEKYSTDILQDTVLDEKFLPLEDVIVYDDIDIRNNDQKVAYVYECPVCFNITITTDPNFDFCTHCENSKFTPKLVGLINIEQMEEIAVNENDTSSYVQIKNDKIIYKSSPTKRKEKSS